MELKRSKFATSSSALFHMHFVDHMYYHYLQVVTFPFRYNVKNNNVILSLKAPNTTKAAFSNTVDPDETAHNGSSQLDLQCLPSSL